MAQLIAKHVRPFDDQLADAHKEKIKYDADVARQKSLCQRTLRDAFPDIDLRLPEEDQLSCINVGRFESSVKPSWKAWSNNHILRQFTNKAETILRTILAPEAALTPLEATIIAAAPPELSEYPLRSLIEIIEDGDIVMPESVSPLKNYVDRNFSREDAMNIDQTHQTPTRDELREIIRTVRQNHPRNALYVDALDASLESLIRKDATEVLQLPTPGIGALAALITCREEMCTHLAGQLRAFATAITSKTWAGGLLEKAGLTPRLNSRLLLQLLSTTDRHKLPAAWNTAIMGFGVAITELQKC